MTVKSGVNNIQLSAAFRIIHYLEIGPFVHHNGVCRPLQAFHWTFMRVMLESADVFLVDLNTVGAVPFYITTLASYSYHLYVLHIQHVFSEW